MSYDVPPDALDRDLVLDFFWRFSVFECSLKREGFLKSGRRNGAEADWTAFAESIRGKFADVTIGRLREAITALVSDPPKRQVVQNHRLAWMPINKSDRESEESFVLRLVKAVRNNLFHGGKYPDGPINEVARDRALLKSALEVLDACYEVHPGIARWATAA